MPPILPSNPVRLEQITNWKSWPIVQQVAAKEYGLSASTFAALLPEYQRFLALTGTTYQLGMFSSEIDKLWHSHLLCTQLYADFCQNILGHFVHHAPTLLTDQTICSNIPCKTQCKTPPPCAENCVTDERGGALSAADFATLYRSAYGEDPPAVWNLTSADAQTEGEVFLFV